MKVPPEVYEPVDYLLRLLDAGAPAKILAKDHRAQTKRADAQAGTALMSKAFAARLGRLTALQQSEPAALLEKLNQYNLHHQCEILGQRQRRRVRQSPTSA